MGYAAPSSPPNINSPITPNNFAPTIGADHYQLTILSQIIVLQPRTARHLVSATPRRGIIIAYKTHYIPSTIIRAHLITRRDSHEMHEMLWADGSGSFTGYERKLSADVDAGPSLPDLRQHRGSTDPFSPNNPAGSESQTAHDTVCKKNNSTSCGGIAIRRCCRTQK